MVIFISGDLCLAMCMCVCTWQEDLFRHMAVFVIKEGNLNYQRGFVDYFCLPPQSNCVRIYGDGSQECILDDPTGDFYSLSYLRILHLEGRWTFE